jgi:hypothetical protein
MVGRKYMRNPIPMKCGKKMNGKKFANAKRATSHLLVGNQLCH